MRPKFSLLNILVAIIGIGLLVFTIRRVGWAEVVSGITSVASVTIENAFYTVSVLVVLLAGTWFFFQRAGSRPCCRASHRS